MGWIGGKWINETENPTILFRKCLGFTDSKGFATQILDTKTGSAELIDCLNMTTTSDGAIEKIAPLVPVLTHTAPITNISAGSRFIYQDGINTKEWNGTTVATIGAVMDGPVAHTPIDVRVSGAAKVYKSAVAGAALSEAVLGNLSGLPDRDTKPYYAQPTFKRAFTHNGHLYGINATDPRFLQHSEYAHFDVYALGDNHIGHATAILQAGAIPGAMICTHSAGVSVYKGTNPEDFTKKFYACKVIDGTLYSGFIGKSHQNRSYGYCHIFLCSDGVYIVTGDGDLVNLTADRASNLEALNTSYACATVHGSKYLAFGNNICLEYDFETNTVLKRASFGVVAATLWNSDNYYATGATVATIGDDIDSTAVFTASMTFPFSTIGTPGVKSFEALYFTGTISGDVLITATDQEGNFWEHAVSEIGTVTNYRIKPPKGWFGNHVSFKFDCASGAFRMEEVRVVLNASKRSR